MENRDEENETRPPVSLSAMIRMCQTMKKRKTPPGQDKDKETNKKKKEKVKKRRKDQPEKKSIESYFSGSVRKEPGGSEAGEAERQNSHLSPRTLVRSSLQRRAKRSPTSVSASSKSDSVSASLKRDSVSASLKRDSVSASLKRDSVSASSKCDSFSFASLLRSKHAVPSSIRTTHCSVSAAFARFLESRKPTAVENAAPLWLNIWSSLTDVNLHPRETVTAIEWIKEEKKSKKSLKREPESKTIKGNSRAALEQRYRTISGKTHEFTTSLRRTSKPSLLVVRGPSGCGKSFFIQKILHHSSFRHCYLEPWLESFSGGEEEGRRVTSSSSSLTSSSLSSLVQARLDQILPQNCFSSHVVILEDLHTVAQDNISLLLNILNTIRRLAEQFSLNPMIISCDSTCRRSRGFDKCLWFDKLWSLCEVTEVDLSVPSSDQICFLIQRSLQLRHSMISSYWNETRIRLIQRFVAEESHGNLQQAASSLHFLGLDPLKDTSLPTQSSSIGSRTIVREVLSDKQLENDFAFYHIVHITSKMTADEYSRLFEDLTCASCFAFYRSSVPILLLSQVGSLDEFLHRWSNMLSLQKLSSFVYQSNMFTYLLPRTMFHFLVQNISPGAWRKISRKQAFVLNSRSQKSDEKALSECGIQSESKRLQFRDIHSLCRTFHERKVQEDWILGRKTEPCSSASERNSFDLFSHVHYLQNHVWDHQRQCFFTRFIPRWGDSILSSKRKKKTPKPTTRSTSAEIASSESRAIKLISHTFRVG